MYTKMYGDFESLWNNTKDSGLSWAIEEIQKVADIWTAFSLGYIYAICMAYIMDILKNVVGEKYSPEWVLSTALTDLDWETDPIEAKEVCNNIMHILHTHNNEMRNIGTRRFCTEFFEDGQDYLHVWYEGIHLNGKSRIPQQFRDQIEEAVAPYGVCEISMLWLYSHLDCGLDYDYSRDEPISVVISCDSVQGLEMAVKAVENLHLVYKPE